MATGKKAPNAGRAIKAQGSQVEITWDVAQTRIAQAVQAEGAAHNKWISASDTLWILGVRPDMFEPIIDSKGKKVETDTYKKVTGMVIKGFSARAQSLLEQSGTALSGLTEAERGERRYWTQRIPVMMSRIIAYLKRHEENDRGVAVKTTLADSIVKVLKVQKGRLQKADAEKVKDIPELDKVLELFDTLIAELS